MRRQILGHTETMGYTKLESLDWCLRTINRKRRVIGKAELRKRLAKDLAKVKERRDGRE